MFRELGPQVFWGNKTPRLHFVPIDPGFCPDSADVNRTELVLCPNIFVLGVILELE